MEQEIEMAPMIRREVAKRKIVAANEMMMEALGVLQSPRASGEAKEAAEGLFHRARRIYEMAAAVFQTIGK